MTTANRPTTTTTPVLRLEAVGDISGIFLVPGYQRGYRWGEEQVRLLLDDIGAIDNSKYCLQPIVVKRLADGRCELIDGQQRLTTLYLIYRYLKRAGLTSDEPRFSLEYETRPHSAQFLASIDETKKDDNIDFFHMYRAYGRIREWFEQYGHRKQREANRIYDYLFDFVYVIWYEVAVEDRSVELFTRLNVGRIPLTNAELVKALLLRKDGDSSGGSNQAPEGRQVEIATQWDLIERELHDVAFWAFLTNKPDENYPTRIELLFELLAGKPPAGEPFHTFFYFKDQLEKAPRDRVPHGKAPRDEVWEQIQERHALLKEWYEDRDLYHKIGYLVATSSAAADELTMLLAASHGLTKSAFQKRLDELITERLALGRDGIANLAYDTDTRHCSRVLLLFNVETVRKLHNSLERYPFHAHKTKQWSLEHIHAQNADELNKKAQWETWLDEHLKYLRDLKPEDHEQRCKRDTLINDVEAVAADINQERFSALATRITELFSDADALDDPHGIENLALLPREANSALGKAIFAVKRRRIINMDRAGEYIPICTRRVFLKYYTAAEDDQNQFWSKRDRASYHDAMFAKTDGLLSPYLRSSTGEAP